MGDTIIETLAKITRIDPAGITEDTLIAEELGIDSLRSIEILATVEKHFAIQIEESELVDVTTVGDFVRVITSQIDQQRGGNPGRLVS